MNINFICVGKLKESWWRDAAAEYSKRIGGYASLKIIEANESRLPDKPSQKEIEQALSAEAEQIRKYASEKKAYNIAMCIEGRQMSSEELAQAIQSASINGFGSVNFIIGSSFGLAKDIKDSSQLRLSISKMTLPHQLARVVLTEQIYRALSIINNGKYHK